MLIYTPDSYSASSPSGGLALFLDRDGVINKEINYLHKIEDFEFIDGIFDLCRTAVERNYRIIVVTNQSGIARGYYNEKDLETLTKWMMREFAGRYRNLKSLCLSAFDQRRFRILSSRLSCPQTQSRNVITGAKGFQS